MDLRLFGRVVRRFWYLVLLGTVAAAVLGTLSFYDVSFRGATPKLTPNKEEVWVASATTLITESGFPAGGVASSANASRFIELAPLYARLANSDAVRRLMIRTGGPIDGEVNAVATADNTYGSVTGLPMVTIVGSASTSKLAIRLADRATAAFLRYVEERQAEANIAPGQRVELQVINAPREPELAVPRKKTLPIVIFLAVMFLTLALAVMLENVFPPRDRTSAAGDQFEGREVPGTAMQDVRRLA